MEKTPRIRKGADVSENIAALHTEPLSFLGIWFAACFPKAGDISVACAYVAPQAAGESSVLEGATQEQTALPAMPGASKIGRAHV